MEYMVIKILNEKEIAIDYGNNFGAKIGEQVIIFEPGEKIIYNNKNYGEMYKIKEKLEIVEVYEEFSICQKIVVEENSYHIFLNNPFVKNEKVKKVKEINVGNLTNSEKTTYKSYDMIRVGDKVKVSKN